MDNKNGIEPRQGSEEKRSLISKIQDFAAGLPSFEDASQKGALANIAKFLVALIALTLISRGASGAALARVSVSNPLRAPVTEAVTGKASVKAQDQHIISAPEGLTVVKALAGSGQEVKAGDDLILFSISDVRAKLERETASLEKMRLNLSKLGREEQPDTSGYDSAALSLERANDDYESARLSAEADIAKAQAALDDAIAGEQQARLAYESGSAQLSEWESASAAAARARSDLETAENKAASDLQSARRRSEDAQASLARSEKDLEKSKQSAADTKAQNSIDAKLQQLDINKQQESIALLQSILSNGGALRSDAGGTVSKTLGQGAITGSEPAAILSDDTGAFEAEFYVSQSDADKLAIGMECEVAIGGSSMYYSPTVKAQISSISAPNDKNQSLVSIKLPQREWKAGQSVDVQAVFSSTTYDICIPLSALRSDSSGYFIYTVEKRSTVLGLENIVLLSPVTLLASDDSMAAVSGPVGRDSLVIAASSKSIAAGDRVRVNQQ